MWTCLKELISPDLRTEIAEGFSVKAHFLTSYRKALGSILKSQMIPARARSGGQDAFEAFAADDDMHTLGLYLGRYSASSRFAASTCTIAYIDEAKLLDLNSAFL